jgi:hypothetical protein
MSNGCRKKRLPISRPTAWREENKTPSANDKARVWNSRSKTQVSLGFSAPCDHYSIQIENYSGARMHIKALSYLTFGLVTLAIVSAAPAAAHHSHAMYNPNVRMTLAATVKEYIWANPHVWVYVEIPDENGNPVEWILESAAPGSLSRNGWTPQSMQPGDKVTVTFGPLKDGTSGGLLGAVVLADGSTVRTGALDNNIDVSDAEIAGQQ